MLVLAATSIGRTQNENEGVTWEGPYQPIPPHNNPNSANQHCCEVAHAILIAKPGLTQGKVLLIQSNGDRWLWDPAAPSTVTQEVHCDNIAPTDNMFCAGHSVDSEGNIVVAGGERLKLNTPVTCTAQPRYSYVYETATGCWSANYPMLVPVPNPAPDPQNLLYYYPSTLRLPDGRVLAVGGGTAPLVVQNPPSPPCYDVGSYYFVDGWQILDRTLGGWQGASQATSMWYDGLPGSYALGAGTQALDFNYYPLLMLLPRSSSSPVNGHVFSPVVTDNRWVNDTNVPGFSPARSPTAIMSLTAGWPSNGAWTVHPSQICRPNTTTPRNLYYPNGFLWPMHLDPVGRPLTPTRFVVLNGTDRNDYVTGTPFASGPAHPFGGRHPQPTNYSIDAPELPGSAWVANTLGPMTTPRIYSNAVILPDETLFVVGGAHYDYFPFKGQVTNAWQSERTADPIFVPEMYDLTNPTAAPQPCAPHISPRLYHSVALLLPDARVLVAGGYRGVKPPVTLPQSNWLPEHYTYHNWENEHSDIEIFSPDYLFQGARPQIVSLPEGNTINYTNGAAANTFEIHVALPGSTTPASAIGSVWLVSPGSVTHHYDWDQRFIRLHAVPPSMPPGRRLTVTPPADRNVAPPGWYMLFVTSDPAATNGVKIPSVAAYVNLQ